MANSGYADRTSLNNLTPNLQPGQVAASALRLQAFQYLYDLSDANWSYISSLVQSGVLSPYPPVNYNKLINGNFDVWQRGNGSVSNNYTLDRWFLTHNHTSVTVSRQEAFAPDGSRYCARLANNTRGTGTFFNLIQAIETMNCLPLINKKLTVSLQLRKSSGLAAGDVSVYITYTPTVNDSAINVANGTVVGTVTIPNSTLTTSFQKFTATANIPANARTIGVVIAFNGSPTDGQYVEIAQAQINPGDTALPFQPRDTAEELMLCQRYFQKSFPINTAPAQNAGANGAIYFPLNGLSNGARVTVNLPTRMRVTPTVVTYNPSGTNSLARNITSSLDVASISTALSESNLHINAFGTNNNTNELGAVHYVLDAEL